MMEVQRSRYIRDSLRPPPRLFLSHCESIGVSMRASTVPHLQHPRRDVPSRLPALLRESRAA
jgi:hypothetical protein